MIPLCVLGFSFLVGMLDSTVQTPIEPIIQSNTQEQNQVKSDKVILPAPLNTLELEQEAPPAPPPTQQPPPPIKEEVAETSPPKSNCDSNYSGCVPIASDVDCAGGSGNGPAYVRGPVYVIGSDIYGLDRDGDGVACQ